MNGNKQSDIVDRAVNDLRNAPVPDGPPPEIQARLRTAYQDAGPQIQTQIIHNRRTVMKRVAATAAAVAVTAALGAGFLNMFSKRTDSAVFADTIKQMQQAKNVSWTTVFINRKVDKEKTKRWHETTVVKQISKVPGLRRTERFDDSGEVRLIEIVDWIRGQRLEIWPQEKRARLTEGGAVPEKDREKLATDQLSRMVARIDGDAESLGKKQIDGREANGFRVLQAKNKPHTSVDLWIDMQTKKLVRVLLPGAHKFDPETDPARNNPPGKRHTTEVRGLIMRDIVFDQELDDALFRFEPPAGYILENTIKPEPTEADVIVWLGVLAEYFGGTFPDQVERGIHIDELNKMIKKKEEDLTAIEKKIMKRSVYSNSDLIHQAPIARFIRFSAGDDWHYAGKGVQRGDREKAIFWYKPAGVQTFRVIYGDLSVKDVAAADLPAK